jgi:hypothetical protein
MWESPPDFTMLALLLACVCTLQFSADALPNTAPCSNALPKPILGGAKIVSLTAAVVNDYAVNITGESNNWRPQNLSGLSFCQVNISLTHVGTGDLVNNQVWLPLSNWNGIFLGIGGGGVSDPA